MSANILSKFKQNHIGNFIESIDSPVRSVTIVAAGSGYANGEVLIFAGDSITDAVGKVFTSNSGAVTDIALTTGGNYVIKPTVTIDTAGGSGASLVPVTDNDHYYVFAGRSLAYDDDFTPDPNFENDYDGFYFQHEQMFFGKKVSVDDVAYMTRKVEWTSNTVYAVYDDKDQQLPEKDFYVITSDNHVFKCIDNAGDALSTVEPTSVQTSGVPARLADGYMWKYMYTVSGSQTTKFMTTNFIPVKENANVVAGAIDGGILLVKTLSGGSAYPAHSGTLTGITGNKYTIANTASSQQNYYANCTLTVFGENNLVTNMPITESYASGSDRIVVVTGTYNANQASVGHSYSLGPTVSIAGDGANVAAYAVMNELNGSVVSVELIDPGSLYNQADAEIISGTAFGSGASVRAIISPVGGHGGNLYAELFCKHLGITQEFVSDDAFPEDVVIRTVGMLKNPTWANGSLYTESSFNQCANLTVANTSLSNFDSGETVIGNTSRARGQVAISNSSFLVLTGMTGDFSTGEILNGQTSGVQFVVVSVDSDPEVKVYSGDVLYLQNISATERSVTQSEQIKLVLKL